MIQESLKVPALEGCQTEKGTKYSQYDAGLLISRRRCSATGRTKAATNETKQSIHVFWRASVGLNVAFSVGHQCLTVPLQM